jgi:hypothetical protein
MEQTFGARLRVQREQSQVTLATIAKQTKIKASLLEALERDDVSQWPSGIFRRAYLRDYARAIGLEPEAVVREFLEIHPDPVPAVGAEGDADADPSRQLTGLRRIVGKMAAVPTFFQRIQQVVPAPVDHAAIEIESAAESARRVDVPTIDATRIDTPVADVPPPPLEAPAEIAVAAPVEVGAPMPDATVSPAAPLPAIDLAALAEVCTRLARLVDLNDFPPLLDAAAHVLDAVGLIVWAWDSQSNALTPTLASGYSDAALARVPPVPVDAANAVAAAFRAGEPCVVNGDRQHTGAVVAPLLAPTGCVGVLAVELRDLAEQRDSTRAVAAILAAQLATLLGPAVCATAASTDQDHPAYHAHEDGPFVHRQGDSLPT